MKRLMLTASLVVLAGPALAQRVVYVDLNVAAGGSGASWAQAYRTIQDALGATASGDEVWVAGGTYRPDEGTGRTRGDRNATFLLPAGVTLRGGFCGDEPRADAVVPGRCPSVLEGDLLDNDVDTDPLSFSAPWAGDNTATMLKVEGSGDLSRLAGFTIRHALLGLRATRSVSLDRMLFRRNITGVVGVQDRITVRITRSLFERGVIAAGGTAIYLVLDSVRVRDSNGGLQMVSGDRGSLVVSRSSFERVRGGHAILAGGTHIRIYNTTFVGGDNVNPDGTVSLNQGVLDLDKCDVLMVNVLFAGNRVRGSSGGALYYSEDPTRNVGFPQRLRMVGVTSYGNTTGDAGTSLMLENTRDVNVANAIFYGGTRTSPYTGTDPRYGVGAEIGYYPAFTGNRATVRNSIVAGGIPPFAVNGGGVSDQDPRFVNAAGADGVPGTTDDDLRLAPGSPALDAGLSDALPADSVDLDDDGDVTEPIPVDLAGRPRVQGRTVDLGAFEADPSVGVEPTSGAALDVRVWPSPAHEAVHIAGAQGHVEVVDALGRRLWTGEMGLVPLVLDVRTWAPGVYAVRNGGRTRSFVVAR